jgi:hypothetical protein
MSLSPSVRKRPSLPRSWANLRLLEAYSHRNAWANLHLLGRPDACLAPRPGKKLAPLEELLPSTTCAAAGFVKAQELVRVHASGAQIATPEAKQAKPKAYKSEAPGVVIQAR